MTNYDIILNNGSSDTMATPFIKWAGGKEREIKYFEKYYPSKIKDYYEPFLGGGAVYLSFEDKNINDFYVNDKSDELISVYENIKEKNVKFINYLENMNINWIKLEEITTKNSKKFTDLYLNYRKEKIDELKLKDTIFQIIFQNNQHLDSMFNPNYNINLGKFNEQLNKNIFSKIKRMKKIELKLGNMNNEDIIDNIETAFKSAFYTHYRTLYNHRKEYKIKDSIASAIFYFIREFCYSSMFRYNLKGHFNVPYGGMGYNRKVFQKKINYLKSEKLSNFLKKANILCGDFEEFINKNIPQKNDFIFLDPPYDTDFSTYANNKFESNDQVRLAEFLYKTKANFMLVIKESELIKELYYNKGFKVIEFKKKYQVNFKNRNNRSVKHLIIKNY